MSFMSRYDKRGEFASRPRSSLQLKNDFEDADPGRLASFRSCECFLSIENGLYAHSKLP